MARYQKQSPLCISEMSGKLQGLFALNTSPLTNPYCMKMSKNPNIICHQCYSILMLLTMRKNSNPAYVRNSNYLSERVIPDDELLDLSKYDIFRYNAHGELINMTHVINFVNMAHKAPDTIIGLWTKRIDLIKKFGKLPSNINRIYSTPKVNILKPRIPTGFNKVFSAYTAEYAKVKKIKINCHGGCDTCRLCYTHNRVKYINEIIKQDNHNGIYNLQKRGKK